VSDLVKRLREAIHAWGADGLTPVFSEAADRIEELERDQSKRDLQLVRQARREALVTIKALEQRIEELELGIKAAKETADHEFVLRLRAHDAARASLATIRREALEEAARVMDEKTAHWQEVWNSRAFVGNEHVRGLIDASEDGAAAIRALMEPKDE
jgi:hypothetical protein